jgi:putative SOS response-associated peptidase YedK
VPTTPNWYLLIEMCGRFTLTYRERKALADELGVPVEQLPEDEYRPRYNIAPTDSHWIVRGRYEERQLLPAKWGLVNSWAKDARRAAQQINARAETLETSPAFREAFRSRRCLVPADGFFEWTGSKAQRRPIWYHRPDGKLILFAGLYEAWRPSEDEWQRTFTIVTTDANGLVRPVHDRMPVILSPEAADAWLFAGESDLEKVRALLRPPPDDLLIATFVSPRVNSVKNDDPECLVEETR